MALLLEAAFAVLAKAVVFSLDRQLIVQTTHLSAPVVGPRRGMIAPAPIREFGRRHHARRELAILVIAQRLRAARVQPGNPHHLVVRRHMTPPPRTQTRPGGPLTAPH